MRKRGLLKTVLLCAGFPILLALWVVATSAGWVNTFLLPPPGRVWDTFLTLLQNGKLASHTLVSLQRVVEGYALASALAIGMGLMMVGAPALANLIGPPLEFLRQIPPLALIPLLLLWLGIGELQKMGIIVLASFFPIYLGGRGGFAEVDPKLIEVGRAADFGWSELLWRIVLPAALPAIVIGLRIGLGYGWRALVGAELIASSSGLGYMILDAQDLARTDIVIMGVLVIGALGLFADWCLGWAVARLASWMRQELELGRA